MENTCRRTWANINLDNLVFNYRQAQMLAAHGPVMAVIKADAYGCGAVQVAKTLQSEGCPYFAVATLDEAIQLRDNQITQPILILGYTHPGLAEELVRYRLTQTVFSKSYAETLSEFLSVGGTQLNVHIKVDSGMSRLGFRDSKEIEAVCQMPNFICEGIFTHFATADTPDENFTLGQYQTFIKIVSQLEEKGNHFQYRHCCNSAAIIKYPQMHLDMVREGIMLYGQYPADISREYITLKPVMELKSSVAFVKRISAGDSVSYGRHYVADCERTIATIPVGYGDGYARALGKLGAYVSINGQRAPLLGSVCMDQIMVDVTNIKGVLDRQEVTLFGNQPSVDYLADLLGTISYEVLCNVGKRVPRVYIKNGADFGFLNYINPKSSCIG